MQNKKAQGVIEFIIIFSAALFFFIVFFSVIQMNTEEKNLEKARIVSQNIVLGIQDEINLAAQSSNGYQREFEIPQNILGREYEINISGSYIYLTLGEKISVSYKISNITGSLQKGNNLIKKENDSVYLN